MARKTVKLAALYPESTGPQDAADFTVHTALCGELKREQRRRGGSISTFQAASEQDAYDFVLDGELDEMGYGEGHVHLHNCVKLALRAAANPNLRIAGKSAKIGSNDKKENANPGSTTPVYTPENLHTAPASVQAAVRSMKARQQAAANFTDTYQEEVNMATATTRKSKASGTKSGSKTPSKPIGQVNKDATPELIAKVVEMRDEKVAWDKIMAETGLTYAQVWIGYHRAKLAPSKRLQPDKVTNAQIQALRTDQNESWGMISAITGLPETKCRAMFREAGGADKGDRVHDRRPKAAPKPATKPAAKGAAAKGKTAATSKSTPTASKTGTSAAKPAARKGTARRRAAK